MGNRHRILAIFLACAIQCLDAQPYTVNQLRLSNCDTKMAINPYPGPIGRGVQDAPCTGLLSYNLDGDVRRICGYPTQFNKASAQRLCYTLGLDLYRTSDSSPGVRLFSCDAYTESGAPLPDSNDNIVNEVYISRLYGKRCNQDIGVTYHDCFDKCYFENDPPGSEQEKDCNEAQEPFWGIACSDINECVSGTLVECTGPFDGSCIRKKACGSNTNCTNIVGSYECACKDGYKPANGDEKDPYSHETGCVDVNECSENEMTCGPTGRCQNFPGYYICLCPQGQFWSDDQKVCDGSICETERPDFNAERPVFQGSPINQATYTCKPGFKAPGSTDSYTNRCIGSEWENNGYCEDVNECAPSQCDENAICINTEGTFSCICPSGYQGNGMTCTGSICRTERPDFNAERPVFQGSPINQATYTCKPGFKAPGSTDSYTNRCIGSEWENNGYCEDVNECAPSQCDENAICINTVGTFSCICPSGYQGNGMTCTAVSVLTDPCDVIQCIYGDCTLVDGVAKCNCESGYKGAACDRQIINKALMVAIAALVIVGMMFLIVILFLISRVLSRPAPLNKVVAPWDEFYGRLPPPLPTRQPLGFPTLRPPIGRL